MSDTSFLGQPALSHSPAASRPGSGGYAATKRGIDVALSLALLPVLAAVALALLIANPFFNRGSLLFVQKRMGQHCRAFRALKFRTMRAAEGPTRGAEAPLEVDRITPLGAFLRQTRLDELPQILNVLRGEMSLIGPRPDAWDHAEHYLNSVPGYRHRHSVRPGISGLAQVEIGYVAGSEATRRKVEADLFYVQHAGLRLEFWLIWRTLSVILRRQGS